MTILIYPLKGYSHVVPQAISSAGSLWEAINHQQILVIPKSTSNPPTQGDKRLHWK